jgi:multidrug resistance protein, MATE family
MSLSWKENPLPTLMRLAGPIAASTISYSLMTLADTLFIGRVGRSELAGVALGGLFSFVLVCFSFGLLRAANVLVAQAVGAGRRDQVAPTLGAALITALALGVVTVVLGQVAAVFIVDLAATEAAGRAAGVYLSIRILGAPLTLSYVALREVRYGLRDARSPMISTVVANLVNIALCWLFVFVLEHGVAGAALATLIANGVELGILIYVQRHQGYGLRLVRRVNLRALWKMGTPTGLQFMLEVGSFAILALLISLLSEAEMAAHQIAIQVIHFSFLPAWAVGEAAAVLAGQAVGAGEDALVIRVGRLAAAVSIAYAAFCAVVFAVAAPLISAGFTADPGVTGVAIKLLYVAAVFQIFDAANVVARAVLRGTGDVRYTAVVGVVTAWVCTPPLTWLLGWQMGLGAFGGWLGLCLELIVSAAILQWRLERRGWAPAAAASRARLAAASATPANDVDGQANEGVPSVAAAQ